MLNEKQLETILQTKLPPLNISDIHWKTQVSDPNSILFYRILPDEEAQKLFTERIEDSQFGWLIINEDHPSRPMNCSIIPDSLWPGIQEAILNILYPRPQLKLIAITGTNGKTTTADLVLQVGELCGKKGISIGTLGVRENHKTLENVGLTSPCLIDLRKFLSKYGAGKDFCVLEASSHALIQNRLYGLQFDTGGWLSFSQDHLDYHKTMEEYFASKLLIIDYLKALSKVFIPSSQEELFNRIHRITDKILKANVIDKKLPLFFSTTFNRNNLEVAVSIIEQTFQLKVPEVYDQIIPPEGRFYIRPFGKSYIVVDFAHTPDALENICQGIREAFPHHRLKVLFGCGGDRDRSKRPVMGRIAEIFSEEVYVTSDNPRSEDPEQIMDDIINGMGSLKIHRIVERPEAVKKAFSELKDHEILLLAGKGNEDYILAHGVKHPYSDILEVENFLARKK
jgi:UDP-N-acetylmuramoyl-L-alanyl-D-glutamate--2,6-diaminopimelate ligase